MVNFILTIPLNMPKIVSLVYSKMTLVSNINLNFSITTPLNYIKEQLKFPPTTKEFMAIGFDTYSILYNTQSQIISLVFMVIVFKIISKIQYKLSKKKNLSVKRFSLFLLKITKAKNGYMYEIYYSQRLYINFAIFHFIANVKVRHYSLHYWLLLAEGITIIMLLLLDTMIMYKWVSYIFNPNSANSKPCLAFQEILHKEKQRPGVMGFELITICIQTIMPIVFTLIFNKWTQISIIGVLTCMMALFISIKLKAFNKLLICYAVNYWVMALLCISWGCSNALVVAEHICGWIMAGLLLTPIIAAMILLLPHNVIEAVSQVKMICKKIKLSRNKKL